MTFWFMYFYYILQLKKPHRRRGTNFLRWRLIMELVTAALLFTLAKHTYFKCVQQCAYCITNMVVEGIYIEMSTYSSHPIENHSFCVTIMVMRDSINCHQTEWHVRYLSDCHLFQKHTQRYSVNNMPNAQCYGTI